MLITAPTLVVGVTATRIIWPPTASPHDVDAIIVLAGGEGERIESAIRLMDADVGPNLVISVGNRQRPGWQDLRPLCDEPSTPPVWCIEARPDSTRGEARTFTTMAEERDWSRLALVTSDYHLHRATLLFERCFDGEIVPVAADAPLTTNSFQHELLATIHAQFVDREC